jgi:PKHD-type hydroxylase
MDVQTKYWAVALDSFSGECEVQFVFGIGIPNSYLRGNSESAMEMASPTPWFLHVPNALPEAVLAQVRHAMDVLPFVDGRTTAGGPAALVKSNLQMADNPQKQQLDQLVLQHVMAVPDVHKAFFPTKVYPLIYAKYGPGNTYGWHLDSPIMMSNQPIRTDLAMTIFISDPATYEGGELEVKAPGAETSWKLAAGDAIFYPATTVHRVAPVTSGERRVIVTWIQSAVREPRHRQLLYDLKLAHEAMESNAELSEAAERVQHAFSHLLREWAEL